jgi:hypothetical protein
VRVVLEESIGVVCQRQRKCGGGRLGSWSARVSWLLRCVIAVGVRACARGSDASRHAAGASASWLVCVLRGDARGLARVVRAGPLRWRRGDRRGAGPGGWWRRSSPDRSASGASGRDGSWLVAGRSPANGGATQRRGALGGCAGSRDRRDPAVRFSARRGRRGAGGCRTGMDAAVRSRSGWRVGARGRDHRWRSAQRPAARPARVLSADPAAQRIKRHGCRECNPDDQCEDSPEGRRKPLWLLESCHGPGPLKDGLAALSHLHCGSSPLPLSRESGVRWRQAASGTNRNGRPTAADEDLLLSDPTLRCSPRTAPACSNPAALNTCRGHVGRLERRDCVRS